MISWHFQPIKDSFDNPARIFYLFELVRQNRKGFILTLNTRPYIGGFYAK